jgi:hypothetical protein
MGDHVENDQRQRPPLQRNQSDGLSSSSHNKRGARGGLTRTSSRQGNLTRTSSPRSSPRASSSSWNETTPPKSGVPPLARTSSRRGNLTRTFSARSSSWNEKTAPKSGVPPLARTPSGRPSLSRSNSERYDAIKAMYRIPVEDELARSHHEQKFAPSQRRPSLDCDDLLHVSNNSKKPASRRRDHRRSSIGSVEDTAWNSTKPSRLSSSTHGSEDKTTTDEEWMNLRIRRQGEILNMSIESKDRFEKERFAKEQEEYHSHNNGAASSWTDDSSPTILSKKTKRTGVGRTIKGASRVVKGTVRLVKKGHRKKGEEEERYDSTTLPERERDQCTLMDRVSSYYVATASETSDSSDCEGLPSKSRNSSKKDTNLPSRNLVVRVEESNSTSSWDL